MRDLAPDITRQRLLVEGSYTRPVDEDVVRRFLRDLPAALDLRSYGDVVVHCPGGQGREANEGYDAFVPLIDSGLSLYVWAQRRFLAVVLFTCKAFDAPRAVALTGDFFGMSEIEHMEF